MQRIGDERRSKHLRDAGLLAKARITVARGIAAHQDGSGRQRLAGRPEVVHSPRRLDRPIGRVSGAHRDPAQIVAVPDVVVAARWPGNEALWHSFGTDHRDHVMLAAGDHGISSLKRDGAGRAGTADIDAGHSLLRNGLGDFVGVETPPHAALEARACGDQSLDVGPRQSGILQGRLQRLEGELKLRLVGPLPPWMRTGAKNIDWPTHFVCTPSRSGANL